MTSHREVSSKFYLNFNQPCSLIAMILMKIDTIFPIMSITLLQGGPALQYTALLLPSSRVVMWQFESLVSVVSIIFTSSSYPFFSAVGWIMNYETTHANLFIKKLPQTCLAGLPFLRLDVLALRFLLF